VLAVNAWASEAWAEVVVESLAARPGIDAVLDRSDPEARRREGLGPSGAREGLGPSGAREAGAAPDGALVVSEGPWRFEVDVARGHKTGFYLDQRDARALVHRLARGARTLDVFAYTGGFSVAAATGGAASVRTVDSSGPALEGARRNLERNGVRPAAVDLVEADAFAFLRAEHAAGARYDLVLLDPPKLAPSAAHVERAARAYKDLNLWALRLVEPGGTLLTWSCSAAVDDALFQRIVAGAALDAGREAQVVGRLGQPADHPVSLAFPESAYLCGLVLHVGGDAPRPPAAPARGGRNATLSEGRRRSPGRRGRSAR
jgi:23S rRNA (cytosine1962-C5)-methyltransferase